MGKTRTGRMVQTAIWLPHDVHARLKELGGQRGMGDEIRWRLEHSLKTVKRVIAKDVIEPVD